MALVDTPVSLHAADAPTSTDVAALYAAHHRWLINWLQRRMAGSSQAADMAQDTFVSVLAGHTKTAIAQPRPFLATIARRLLANHYRRLALEEAYLQALSCQPQALQASPESQSLVIEALVRIDQALAGLPDKAREAFLLVHLDGLKYAEVAAMLGVSQSAVKKYLSRAHAACLLLSLEDGL